MKFIKSFLFTTLAVAGFSVAEARAQTYAGGSSDRFSTQTIERKVFKEIIKLPYYGAFDFISFEVKSDTVILSGKVVRPLTKKQAEESVEDVAGVNRVVNNIEVLPLSRFDDSIRYRTARAFAETSLYRYLQEPNPSVRIIVENGRVTLEGYVATRGDSNLMNILSNTVSGVFNVQNNLIVGKDRVH